MKAILMSIKPQWCEKIFNGSKTIEVRKTVPRLETPFTVYMYETLGKRTSCRQCAIRQKCTFRSPFGCYEGAGAVVGSFVCDRIDEYTFSNYEARYRINDVDIAKTCLNHPELIAYGKGKPLYGWHITEPKLFDEPLELKYFIKGCDDMLDPQYGSYCGYCPHPCNITRPPQSWCYVEV